MIWIIAGHLFFYGPSAVENLQMVLTYAEVWYLQPLFSVAIAVDTYFVIRYLFIFKLDSFFFSSFYIGIHISFIFSVAIISLCQKWIGFVVFILPDRKEKEEGKCNSQVYQLSG